jgi:hypothetical protein
LKDRYGRDYCGTREPAAPFDEKDIISLIGSDNETLKFLESEEAPLFEKYRALYYIRNLTRADMINKLATLLESAKLGALIKHEVKINYFE